MLLKRNQAPSLGKIEYGPSEYEGLSCLATSDPMSDNFEINGVGDSPKEICTYLLSVQKKRYNITTVEQGFPYAALISHVKLLLKKHTPLTIKRGICLAAVRGNHPFTFLFVEKMIQEIDHAQDSD